MPPSPPTPEEAVSVLKKYNIFHASSHHMILRVYTRYCNTYMITDYPHNNSAERKGGRGGTDRSASVTRACKLWDFKSSVVWSRRIKHFFAPSLSQTKNSEFGVGWSSEKLKREP